MNEIELKTHVSEKIHDDFLVLSRLLGFDTKAEFLRFIITREVSGTLPQIQNSSPHYGLAGRDKGGGRA